MIASQQRGCGESSLKLRSLLETITISIARRTKVPEIEQDFDGATFYLKVDPYDQGRFVGKLGGTIWGIQTLFWYAGLTQFGWSYSVKLFDHPKEERKKVPFKLCANWDRKKIENLVGEICETCLRSYCQWSLVETGEASLTVNLKLMRYLRINLTDPSFVEAFDTVLQAAGMSNGVKITTEATWE